MVIGKVDHLTAAQWDAVRAIRGEYVAASMCTDPADRPAAEAAIRRIYELARFETPQFIWCQSPAAVRLVVRMLEPASAERRALQLGEWDPTWLNVGFGGAFEAEIWRSLSGALGRALRSELWHRLTGWPHMPGFLVGASTTDVLERPLADLLGEPFGKAAEQSAQGIHWPPPRPPDPPRWIPVATDYLGDGWQRGGGQFHNWRARLDVPRRLGLVSYGEQAGEWLDLSWTLTRSCGWWEPYEDVCFVTERPAVLRAEPRGHRGELWLHCRDGPAITYRDGWSVYAWHGMRVPSTLIEDGWDVPTIMAEPNGEVRRCAIEKFGWDKFEEHLIPVASAPDPGNPGQILTLCDLPAEIRNTYHGPLRLLLCSNGTPAADGTRRRFALQVPRHHTDPVAAAAETYAWSRDEYASLARRA